MYTDHSGASDGAWMINIPISLAAAKSGSILLFSFSNRDASAVSFQTSTITNAVVAALARLEDERGLAHK